MPRLVPRLKAERRNAEFRSRQRLWRTQQVHPCGVQPNAGALFVWCGLEDRDLTDPGTTQRKRQRASGLPAADDRHVVFDALPIGNPVGRIGTHEAQRISGMEIRIF
jgi:hypothetical protein